MQCPRRAESLFAPRDREDRWREDNTCSYCGSLNPDEFLRRAEASEQLGPTDKNYKVYVGARDKFYFQHLDETQQQRFVDLHNAKKLAVDYPGHFYVLPFFMRRVPPPPQ